MELKFSDTWRFWHHLQNGSCSTSFDTSIDTSTERCYKLKAYAQWSRIRGVLSQRILATPHNVGFQNYILFQFTSLAQNQNTSPFSSLEQIQDWSTVMYSQDWNINSPNWTSYYLTVWSWEFGDSSRIPSNWWLSLFSSCTFDILLILSGEIACWSL